MNPKASVGLAVLVCTLLGIIWSREQDTGTLPSTNASPPSVGRRSVPSDMPAAMELDTRDFPAPVHDPFAPVSFTPPQSPPVSPPVQVVTPVVRTAPAFPYHYFGRMTGADGVSTVYLTRDDKLIAVRPAQVLDTDYRIESIDATRIVVTYLPLGEKVTLVTAAID